MPGTATRVISAGSGAEARAILADRLPTLRCVHGVVRLPAWDLAVECVEEALASGAVPSLERLGRLGPARLAAVLHRGARGGRRPGRARGRLRAGAGEPGPRAGRDRRRAARARPRARAARRGERAGGGRPLPGRLRGPRHRRARRERAARSAHRAPQPPRVPRAALGGGRARPPLPRQPRARPLRPRPLQGDERPRRATRRATASCARSRRRSPRTLRETDVAGRIGGDEFAALLLGAAPPDVDAFVARLAARAPRGPLGQRRRRPPPRPSARRSSSSSRPPTAASTRTSPPGRLSHRGGLVRADTPGV